MQREMWRTSILFSSAFPLTYHHLFLRRFKEVLQPTMIEHESVFEDQIHELHRLYWRQKELMMEMDGAASQSQPSRPEPLYPVSRSVQPLPRRTTSLQWMNSSSCTSKTNTLPQQDPTAWLKARLSGKRVFDLESPAYDYIDVLEPPNFQPDKLPQSKCLLDLNEPAKIEGPSESELNQSLNPATGIHTASNAVVGESDSRDFIEESEIDPHGLNDDVDDQPLSVKCQEENEIDVNTYPLSSDEHMMMPQKIASERPQDSFSSSFEGNYGPEEPPPRIVVQALPCSRGIMPSQKLCRSLMRFSTRSRKKGRRGPKTIDMACIKSARNKECSQTKISRTKFENIESVLIAEEDDEGRDAAKAIVEISSSNVQANLRTSAYNAACGNLHWFADIASLVCEDSESEFRLCASGCHNACDGTGYAEGMRLQLKKKKKVEEQYSLQKASTADHRAAVSNTSTGKPRSRRGMKGIISGFTPKEKRVAVDWGMVTRGRRGPRLPASTFQSIISQV